MRFIFFGSFRVSANILERYVEAGGPLPCAVVCSPDRPAGRKQVMTAPAVKTLVQEKQWPIKMLQPEKLPSSPQELEKWQSEIGEIDIAVVMGYPQIIKKEILALPRLGTIGVHPSLLPHYRGASPMQSALLDGATETGISIYQMDEKMDHGPVFSQASIAINPDETNTTLEAKVGALAGELLARTLPRIVTGELSAAEQNHALATYTRKFTTADAEVDIAHDSQATIYNKIRAFNPEPGCWTMNLPGHEGKRVKLLEAQMAHDGLIITRIQPDGKKPIATKQRLLNTR